jgi:glycosyltransferase involved in cell wall biosynthesis
VFCPIPHNQFAARIFWEQCILPLQLRHYHIDLLFTPSVAIPVAWRGKKVSVIHDAAPFHPEVIKYPPLRQRYVRWMTRYAARHSNVVVAVSETARADLAEHCGVTKEKIVVAPDAVGEEFRPIGDAARLAQVRAKYRLPEHFILFLGTIEPGKNLVRLIQAFRRLKLKRPDLPHHLILAGERGWMMQSVEAEIARQPTNDIRFLGFVAGADLPALYSAADLFVYPSLYEGFGLPLVEAMACGTPVITSNVSAMPEVVGDAAVLVSPDDVASIADAMETVLGDSSLRATLVEAGLVRSRAFRWEETARVIARVFNTVGEAR